LKFKLLAALLFLLVIGGTAQAKEKELTCRLRVDNEGHTTDSDAAQLTIDEDAGNVFWHWEGMTAPVPAAFTSDLITWTIHLEHPRSITEHYELNRNTGLLLVNHAPLRSCSASLPKI
jgi:hypothetical protein